jgi:membrane protease YdiL (CAAX protease family)
METMTMRLLRGPSGEVRPVWKLSGFLGMVVAAFGLTGVVAGLVGTFLAPAALQWLFPLMLAVLVVLATWVCLRLEKRGFADLGLQLTRRRLLEGGAGFAIGAVLFSGIALTQAAMVGVPWQLSRADVAGAVAAGLAMMLISVLVEELLFRGYLFRQLTALGGPVLALVVTSVAFGVYHLIGKPYWAIGAFFVVAMPALGGLIFGCSLLRSGGLALPLGLHWGGNWALTSLFGWRTGEAANAIEGPRTMWTADVTQAQMNVLTAPDLVPHLPYLTALVIIGIVIWRYPPARWGNILNAVRATDARSP